MFERLDRLRAEVERIKGRIEEEKTKLKTAEQRLQAAENTQILADVSALNLTPEQFNEFLRLATGGLAKKAEYKNDYESEENEDEED